MKIRLHLNFRDEALAYKLPELPNICFKII